MASDLKYYALFALITVAGGIGGARNTIIDSVTGAA